MVQSQDMFLLTTERNQNAYGKMDRKTILNINLISLFL